MPRQYVVTLRGQDAETVKNASKAADLIIGDDRKQPRGQLVSQLANMNPGETTYFNNGSAVQVMGTIGEPKEEDEPAVGEAIPPRSDDGIPGEGR